MDTTISNWLRRIFSLQTISVLAAIVAAYYAYKSYKQNTNSDITIEIYDPVKDELININETPIIITLITTLDDIDFIHNRQHIMYLPHITNVTDKSLKNFKCDITIKSFSEIDVDFEDEEVGPDYKLIGSEDKFAHIRYRENVLHAQSLMTPFVTSVSLDPDEFEEVHYEFNISYDGLEKPLLIYEVMMMAPEVNGLPNDIIRAFFKGIKRVFLPQIPNTIDADYSVILSDGEEFYFIKNAERIKETDYDTITLDDIKEYCIDDEKGL